MFSRPPTPQKFSWMLPLNWRLGIQALSMLCTPTSTTPLEASSSTGLIWSLPPPPAALRFTGRWFSPCFPTMRPRSLSWLPARTTLKAWFAAWNRLVLLSRRIRQERRYARLRERRNHRRDELHFGLISIGQFLPPPIPIYPFSPALKAITYHL